MIEKIIVFRRMFTISFTSDKILDPNILAHVCNSATGGNLLFSYFLHYTMNTDQQRVAATHGGGQYST